MNINEEFRKDLLIALNKHIQRGATMESVYEVTCSFMRTVEVAFDVELTKSMKPFNNARDQK